MPKVKVNDINIYYEIHGDGFPFVMIRGLSSNIYYWDSYMIDEVSKGFKTIIFDNRGAKLALFDHSAHAIFSHEPELVVKTILNFLK